MPSLTSDEREPLLPKTTDIGEQEAQVVVQNQATNDDSEDDVDNQPVKDELTRSQLLLYIALVLSGLIALGLLIKGLIESGDVEFDFVKALKAALGGGLSGAAAMVLQVLALMPLRTVMNYQYRYGTGTITAIKTLYDSGGFVRYYQGLSFALIQGPVSRFGDTAANAGILALLESNPYMRQLSEFVKTIFASLVAASFRIVLTPVDTFKTTLQTQGRPGMRILKNRVKRYGIGTLWYGALATAAATFVGHYPWFATYNYLQTILPKPDGTALRLLRQAFIGFVASVTSDTISNSLRVLKTYRQTNDTRIGYVNAARAVIAADGIRGLFGRGLKTRILANGIQGLMFSVLWKLFMDMWAAKHPGDS